MTRATAVGLGGWAAIAGILLFGFATVDALMRLLGKRADATELDATGFEVHDSVPPARPWSGGGKEFDGALPDACLGFEETRALMLRLAAARR